LQKVLWHIPRERAEKDNAIERKGEIGLLWVISFQKVVSSYGRLIKVALVHCNS
jgi:hypothetical protein